MSKIDDEKFVLLIAYTFKAPGAICAGAIARRIFPPALSRRMHGFIEYYMMLIRSFRTKSSCFLAMHTDSLHATTNCRYRAASPMIYRLLPFDADELLPDDLDYEVRFIAPAHALRYRH